MAFDNDNSVFHFNVYKPHSIRGFFHKVRSFFRNLKYAKQRIERGYSGADLWNFDLYLQRVLAGGLRDLSKINTGYPDAYPSEEAWKKDLNDVADLVERFNPDDIFDDYSESMQLRISNGEFIRYYDKAVDEADEAKSIAFDWLKIHFDQLWD